MNRVLIRILQIVLPMAVLAVAGFAAVLLVRSRPPVETQPPLFEPPGVRVHEVTARNVPMTVISQGTVGPRTESQLVPEITGRVIRVAPSFAEGGFFEAGDVLVEIDPFDYQQAVVSARSQLAQARLQLAQEEAEAEVALREWEELGRGDPRALTLREPQLDDARASVAAAVANLERSERDLERAEIVAPYAGRIRVKNVDVGQFVTVGTTVATIYAVDLAEVRLPLPDEELAYLNLPLSYRGGENQPTPQVTLRATFAAEMHEWEGRIVRTESEIDPVSRMVHVVAQVADPYAPGPNPNRPPLAVGMYVEAEIEGRTVRDVAVVPRAALRGRDQVLVVDAADKLVFRDVDILRATNDSIFVRDGLAEGELVVVSPLDAPTDGMQVQLADADPSLLARRGAAATPAPEAVEITAASTPGPEALEEAPTTPREVASVTTAASNDQPAEPALVNERPRWLSDLAREGGTSDPGTEARVDRTASDAAADEVRTAGSNAEPAPRVNTRAGRAAPPSRRDPERRPAPEVSPPPAPASAGEAGDGFRPTVAVAPFASLSQNADEHRLGAALASAVAEDLAAAGSLTVRTSEGAAQFVVSGGVQKVGQMVRVTARIVDNEADAVLRAFKLDGNSEDLTGVRSELVASISQSLTQLAGVTGGNRAEASPRNDTAPASDGTSALAVLPFDDLGSTGGDGPDDDLGKAFTDTITAQLAELPVVTIVPSDEGATLVVGGGIQRVGGAVRVTVRVIDTASGAIIAAIKVDGSVEDLADLQARVAAAARQSIEDAVASQVDIGAKGTHAAGDGRRS